MTNKYPLKYSLERFNPTELMELMKSGGGGAAVESRRHGDMAYFFKINSEFTICGIIDENTKYYIEVMSEDQKTRVLKHLTPQEGCRHLKDYQVVGKLEELKYKILNNLELN